MKFSIEYQHRTLKEFLEARSTAISNALKEAKSEWDYPCFFNREPIFTTFWDNERYQQWDVFSPSLTKKYLNHHIELVVGELSKLGRIPNSVEFILIGGFDASDSPHDYHQLGEYQPDAGSWKITYAKVTL